MEQTILYGHLRLRLRDDSGESNSLVKALEGCALIRELHTYGKLIAVSRPNSGNEAQHMGVGTQLMREAERIAIERGFMKIAVIAGVGVRRYYAKLGYKLEDTYMVKQLTADKGSTITEEQVEQDDDNDNGGFISMLKGFMFGK